jgi:hypothetical protein
VSTTIPLDEVDVMAETIYNCPDNHWALTARFRLYKDPSYKSFYDSSGSSATIGYHDVSKK